MAKTKNNRDFFISYNSADERWAVWIAWQLENAGYSTIIQAWDFRPGSNFVIEMQNGTSEAERTVAVLSNAFLNSGFTQPEWAAAFAEDPTGGKGLLLPVRVEQCEPRGLLPQIIYIDIVGLAEKEAQERLLAGAKRERAKPKVAPQFPKGPAGAPTFPGALPAIWNIPHLRNPNFTGRDALLDDIHKSLTSGKPAALTQAIHGMGGVGKTQIAAEYAYQYATDYNLVWWIRSEEAASLASDVALLAKELNLPEKDEPDQSVITGAVRHWLEHSDKWLLIFDNVPSQGDVSPYLPRGGVGHILITSRDANWGALAAHLPVGLWQRHESVEFILRRATSEGQHTANQLAEILGDLPLALAQATVYMEETATSIRVYLDLFREEQQELLKRGTAFESYELTAATTWEASFKRIEAKSPAGAALLNLCAFLAPDDIPLDIIREGAEHLPERLAAAVRDPLLFNQAIAALRRYSLVEVAGDALSVHRLVQVVTRDRLSEETKRAWVEGAARLINGAFPYDSDFPEHWPICSRLLSHALAAAAYAEELNAAVELAGRLLNQTGLYLQGRAQFAEARAAFESALRIGERAYGPDHPEVAGAVNNLGGVLQDQGDLPGARAAYERALRIDEQAHGPNHPGVARDLNNLGGVLRNQGDLPGARAAYERALRIAQQAYGPDHPNVATCVSNLGGVLYDQGDLPGARAAYERALRIDEHTYGPDHSGVARNVNNLGLVLQAQGDLAGARAALERALRTLRQLLGDEHPNTLLVRRNLASLRKPPPKAGKAKRRRR